MEADIELMRLAGLGRGGSFDNCIIFEPSGSPRNPPLRFIDEKVRHKTLDALGDLSLCGNRLVGTFSGNRIGHALNHACIMALFADERNYELVDV